MWNVSSRVFLYFSEFHPSVSHPISGWPIIPPSQLIWIFIMHHCFFANAPFTIIYEHSQTAHRIALWLKLIANKLFFWGTWFSPILWFFKKFLCTQYWKLVLFTLLFKTIPLSSPPQLFISLLWMLDLLLESQILLFIISNFALWNAGIHGPRLHHKTKAIFCLELHIWRPPIFTKCLFNENCYVWSLSWASNGYCIAAGTIKLPEYLAPEAQHWPTHII